MALGAVAVKGFYFSFSSMPAFVAPTDVPRKIVGTAYRNGNRNWDASWGTPAFGAYAGDDTNAMAYHAEILSEAGVDFIFTDWANNTPLHPLALNFVMRTGSSFQSESAHSWEAWGTEDLRAVAGDFNGDGLDDVGHWSATSGKWRFLYAPSFEHSQGWGNYLGWTNAVGTKYQPFTGDFNEDGLVDLGLRDTETGDWHIRHNSGGSWDSAETVIHRAAGASYQPYTGDFNGDGQWDIGMRNPTSGRFYFWSGSAYGQTYYDWTPGTNLVAFAGDFNGDGTTDIALRNIETGEITIQDGPAFSSGRTVPWDRIGDYWTPLAGDWDGDGKADIGLHNHCEYNLSLKAIENDTFKLLDTWKTLAAKPNVSIMLGIRDLNHLTDGRFQAKVDYVYDEIIRNPEYGPMVQYFDGKPLLLVWTRHPTLFPGGIPDWTDDRFTIRFGTAYLENPVNGDLTGADPRNAWATGLGWEPKALYGHWSWEQRDVRAYSMDDQGVPECMTVQTAYRAGQGLPAKLNTAGTFFKQTWQQALNVDPRIVLIPTFNEWFLSEQVSAENARDIEPSVEFGTLFMDILKQKAALFKASRSDLILRKDSTGIWTLCNNPDFWYRTEKTWAVGTLFQGVAGHFTDDEDGSVCVRNSNTGSFFIRSAKTFSVDTQIGVAWSARTGTDYHAVAGDLNEDGITDLGVRNAADGKWYFRESTGSGQWSASETVISRAAGAHYQPYTGDFNGDGEWDIGMRDPNTGKFFFWMGPSYAQTVFEWTAGANYDAFSGDFNADGYWDIGLRNQTSGQIAILFSSTDGAMAFGDQQTSDGPAGTGYSVMTTDVR